MLAECIVQTSNEAGLSETDVTDEAVIAKCSPSISAEIAKRRCCTHSETSFFAYIFIHKS
jgi:hypothetical protein